MIDEAILDLVADAINTQLRPEPMTYRTPLTQHDLNHWPHGSKGWKSPHCPVCEAEMRQLREAFRYHNDHPMVRH